jgi:hypothetical protein
MKSIDENFDGRISYKELYNKVKEIAIELGAHTFDEEGVRFNIFHF